MKPNDTIEKIHEHLSGVMTAEEKMQFDKELQEDVSLREEVIAQQEIIYAIRRMAMAAQLQQLQQEMLLEESNKPSGGNNGSGKVVPIRPYARVIRIGLSVVAGIAAVLALGFWVAPLLQSYFTEQPTVATVPQPTEFVSPIKGLEAPSQALELEAEKGQTFQLPSGTQINVPPNVFTDASGAAVSGKVQIVYREYHDGLEALASGIPLENEGKRLETVGMFEIQGYQNGEPVTLNGSIDVQLASFTDAPGYSHFHLASHRTDESSGQPVVQWQQISALSELVMNARKKAYFDSLRQVYYAQAEAYAKTAFENQQLKAQESNVSGWQLKTVKSNVIMSWLNTQGMEYIGFYPEQEDPDGEMSWVKSAKWQKANAAVASFMPMTQVNLPSVGGNFTQASFSPDGKKLILKATNTTLLYRSNGQLISRIPMKEAVFTSDGEHVIGLSDKKELRCYRTSDGTFVAQYGELIPTNSREYDPKINNSQRAATSYVGQVMDYDISPDGQRVVTIHTDESAVVWEIGGKIISRRKGLPKSWFTEVMFTNRNGTEMIGKMHDGAIVRLNDQWVSLGRSNSFSRPPRYDGGLFDKKWDIVHSNQTLKQPDLDFGSLNSNSQMIYKNVAQHVFYINRKQQDSWQPADTLYVTGIERASLYAIDAEGQHIALLMGKDKLQIWQKTDDDKKIYRLSLEGASFDVGKGRNLDASAARFYTYVQPGNRPRERKQPRLATFEELRQRNLKVAEQKLKLAMEKHIEEADHLRIFHVTKFGIYQVTRQFQEEKVTYNALTLSAENSAGKLKLLQLAGNRQTVIIPLGEFALNNPVPVAFDATGGHLIGVLPDGAVLVFSARDFSEWLREHATQQDNAPRLVLKRVASSEVNYRNLKQLLEQS